MPSAPYEEEYIPPYEAVDESSRSYDTPSGLFINRGVGVKTDEVIFEPKKRWFSSCSDEGTLTFVNKKVKFVGKIKNKLPYSGKWYDLNDKPLISKLYQYNYENYPFCKVYDNKKLDYEGNAPYGRGEGKGKVYYYTGELRYEGELKKGEINGNGKYYYKSGEVICGDNFKNEYLYGFGKKYYKNGNLEYEGEFKKDKFEGKGKYYYEYGEIKYEGEFQCDRFEGQGTLYLESGKKFIGSFQSGVVSDYFATIVYNDGSFYQGNCHSNLEDGFGVLYDKNGKYVKMGYWVHGKYHSTRSLSSNLELANKSNHVYYEGERNDLYQYDGMGTLFRFDNLVLQKGVWSKGLLKDGVTFEYIDGLHCKYDVKNFVPIFHDTNKKYYDNNGQVVQFGRYIDGRFNGLKIRRIGDQIIVTINEFQITDKVALEFIKNEEFSKIKF